MIWTLEECDAWMDTEGVLIGWAVIDENGEQIEFFRERESAEDYLAGRDAAWAEQEAEAAAERREWR